MRTRNQLHKQQDPSSGGLSDLSRESVGKVLNRKKKKQDQDSCLVWPDVLEGSNGLDKQKTDEESQNMPIPMNICPEEEGQKGNVSHALPETKEDLTDLDWEDGFIGTPESKNQHDNTVVVEFYDDSPSTSKKKPVRRATAEEKELAELLHRVHLLCLLARGRLVDSACNDPLIQGALVSLLPSYLLKIADVPKLTANALAPLVQWFHDNFKVECSNRQERSFSLRLAFAFENRKGTAEEIAALSVALFRALNLTARFVSILDVVPLKPISDGISSNDGTWLEPGLFESSTLMVTKPGKGLNSKFDTPSKTKVQSPFNQSHVQSPLQKSVSKDKISSRKSLNEEFDAPSKAPKDISGACETKSEGSKRKGDLEFELQLQMAVSATASEIQNKGKSSSELEHLPSNSSYLSSPQNKFKRIKTEEVLALSQGISTAVGSKKVGAPLYWAEVFCGAESEMGKWVHVDAVNSLIGREEKVEAAISACKKNLRYVVAFAGGGAKDVTRRYCNKWYMISSKRVSSQWWDLVLAPLKHLESRVAGSMVRTFEMDVNINLQPSRSSLEDMELQTRALTEPLPTNQQAYRNHPLYVIERWLTKYEILRPKGPVLGYCSGHPVYPQTCVQTLQTKQRWLREGLQIKANEIPAKVLKHSPKRSKGQTSEPGVSKEGDVEVEGSFALYGKWQTEPLDLPYAVNGIVPKNERGQVDVWSEKCLPHGTVHLRLPRVFSVAKRLGIDYAPAMVGFEFRNGRSYPVYEGIVVCSEFKDIILEAYAEEEVKRTAEERRRHEAQAISRWFQLFSSILTRQRLKETYGDDSTSEQHHQNESTSGLQNTHPEASVSTVQPRVSRPDLTAPRGDHEHMFPIEDQSFDEESSVRTKRCPCGFLVQVEEF